MEYLLPIAEHSDWLEQEFTRTASSIKWSLHRKRVEFGKQKLSIHQFIPCKLVGDVWIVLEEPCNSCADNCNFDKCLEYQQAKSNCIFEGFETVKEKFIHDTEHFYIESNNIKFLWNFNGKWELYKEFKTIEDLVPYKPKLTTKAKQQIGL